jgi:hypothetical protein
MTDELILRLVDETCQVLARMEFFMPCRHLIPSYNALVQATQVNHPDDPYLNTAFPLLDASENGGRLDKHGGDASAITPPQLRILFTQLRIILESLQEEPAPTPGSRTDSRSAEDVDIYRELYRSEGKKPTREQAGE